MPWKGDAIVCRDCWNNEPWFLKKIPTLPNELAPVPNPSAPPQFQYISEPDNWENHWLTWDQYNLTTWEKT